MTDIFKRGIETKAPERIAQISKARGFNARQTLSNIIGARAEDSYHQEIVIERVNSLIENDQDIRLLILDSIIGHYRADFLGTDKLPDRQMKLYRFMSVLSSIAQTCGIAIVVTNQVNSCYSRTINPTGGNIMAHSCTYRISLQRKTTDKIVARLVASPYHPENETDFTINEKGIEDTNMG